MQRHLNPAGMRAYEKAGFEEFGRRKESHRIGGELRDEVFMDCPSTEFERPVTAGKDWGFSAWLSPEGAERGRDRPRRDGSLDFGLTYRVAEALGAGLSQALPGAVLIRTRWGRVRSPAAR